MLDIFEWNSDNIYRWEAYYSRKFMLCKLEFIFFNTLHMYIVCNFLQTVHILSQSLQNVHYLYPFFQTSGVGLFLWGRCVRGGWGGNVRHWKCAVTLAGSLKHAWNFLGHVGVFFRIQAIQYEYRSSISGSYLACLRGLWGMRWAWWKNIS